jgi:hypothetical protein
MAPEPGGWHGGPMLTSRTARLALLAVLGTLVAAASTAPAASAATQRYAIPDGSGTSCSSASPCDVSYAIEFAKVGDEVIIEPGIYDLPAPQGAPDLTIYDPAQITIHGVAGQPAPVLWFHGPNQGGLGLSHGSTLRHVVLNQTEPGRRALRTWDAELDQVIVKASSSVDCAAWITGSTMRNSIVAGKDTAICAEAGPPPNIVNASQFRNVTAVATAQAGVAIDVYAHGGANATISVVNVIATGGQTGGGLAIRTDSSGAHATINATHTNFSNYWTSGTSSQFVDGGGNQGTPPKFVNPADGDYRQAAWSPTIDAGLNDPFSGPFDVDGDPRTVGTTDIGADEFVVAPAATTGPASALTDHSAALSGSVNANGAPTSYRFEYGPTTAYGSSTPTVGAGSGTGAVAAAATLTGLSPATTYHYRLVATNGGGATKGTDQTFTTASPPPPTSPSPTPTSTSTTQTPTTQTPTTQTPTSETPTTQAPNATPAFAGVRLVSTRLSLGGRFVALKLSCPAGTVGRCSGRTKLTARRRASSGTASSVTLGRAPFSIAAGKQAKVRVRVSRAGRRLLGRERRLRGKDTNAARDAAGRSKTTVAAVTIRRRQR